MLINRRGCFSSLSFMALSGVPLLGSVAASAGPHRSWVALQPVVLPRDGSRIRLSLGETLQPLTRLRLSAQRSAVTVRSIQLHRGPKSLLPVASGVELQPGNYPQVFKASDVPLLVRAITIDYDATGNGEEPVLRLWYIA